MPQWILLAESLADADAGCHHAPGRRHHVGRCVRYDEVIRRLEVCINGLDGTCGDGSCKKPSTERWEGLRLRLQRAAKSACTFSAQTRIGTYVKSLHGKITDGGTAPNDAAVDGHPLLVRVEGRRAPSDGNGNGNDNDVAAATTPARCAYRPKHAPAVPLDAASVLHVTCGITAEQLYAADKVLDAVALPAGKPHVFLLDAMAGAGKTHLLSTLIRLLPTNPPLYVAPTLTLTIGMQEKHPGLKCHTTCAFLMALLGLTYGQACNYLTSQNEDNAFTMAVEKHVDIAASCVLLAPPMHGRRLILWDEYTLTQPKTLAFVYFAAVRANAVLCFVGDSAQMAPMQKSKMHSKLTNDSLVKAMAAHTLPLTKNMRFRDDPSYGDKLSLVRENVRACGATYEYVYANTLFHYLNFTALPKHYMMSGCVCNVLFASHHKELKARSEEALRHIQARDPAGLHHWVHQYRYGLTADNAAPRKRQSESEESKRKFEDATLYVCGWYYYWHLKDGTKVQVILESFDKVAQTVTIIKAEDAASTDGAVGVPYRTHTVGVGKMPPNMFPKEKFTYYSDCAEGQRIFCIPVVTAMQTTFPATQGTTFKSLPPRGSFPCKGVDVSGRATCNEVYVGLSRPTLGTQIGAVLLPHNVLAAVYLSVAMDDGNLYSVPWGLNEIVSNCVRRLWNAYGGTDEAAYRALYVLRQCCLDGVVGGGVGVMNATEARTMAVLQRRVSNARRCHDYDAFEQYVKLCGKKDTDETRIVYMVDSALGKKPEPVRKTGLIDLVEAWSA